MAPRPEFADVLETLSKHGVGYILVGGVAAVLSGAPISTFDTDVLVEGSAENLTRLLAALREMDAGYRELAGRRLPPTEQRLTATGPQLFTTRFGNVDVMRSIGRGRTYDELLTRTRATPLRGHSIRVLELEAVIQSKEEAGREKDRAVLPQLRETLRLRDERRARGD
jgi:hypothetical protein